MKRLRSQVKNIIKPESSNQVSKQHNHGFETEKEIQSLRTALLEWYDVNKRDLQWRNLAKHTDPNVRAYSVLVSEIMLQQTQVATVKSYYSKWIEKWPNITSLSQATLEEVNTIWSGLGYYSRGRRLFEAACKVVEEMDGNVPQTAEQLQKKLPGVGPYTAAAIGSIAFNEPVGLVDGNVIRVFSRLFSIGADITRKNVVDVIWRLANQLVDPIRPGDFNQALMELGATVCTPKSPSCESCPTRFLCGAYRRTTGPPTTNSSAETSSISADIEDFPGCDLCLPLDQPWIAKDGVTNYPRKAKKTAARIARNIVLIVERPVPDDSESHEYLLWQRPANGLLANLWEFPSFASQQTDDSDKSSELTNVLDQSKGFPASQAIERFQFVTDVYHQFSHISQTYGVYHIAVSACDRCDDADMSLPDHYQGFKWLNARQISEAAISTAMKKVFRAFTQNDSKASTSLKRKAKSKETGTASKKQMTLQSYFRNQNETNGSGGAQVVKKEQN